MLFEPTRTAAACLADAYGRLVPVRRRTVGSERTPRDAPAAAPHQRTGGAR